MDLHRTPIRPHPVQAEVVVVGARCAGAATALLLARFVSPRLGAIGAAMSLIAFAIILSCLFTTPGVGAPEAGGFPMLSAEVGQVLSKDFVMFAASVLLLGEALSAGRTARVQERDARRA